MRGKPVNFMELNKIQKKIKDKGEDITSFNNML